MNKKIIIGIVVAVIIIAAGLWFFGQPNKLTEEPINNNVTGQNQATSTGMANPASVYCQEQGGKLEIREGDGGQQGVCVMPGGTECDEWEFFRTKICAATSTVPVGNNDVCGRENCHGLDINCGANIAEVCTMEYQLGDKCLRLVNCGIKEGVCQEIPNAAFDACKTCVQKCMADFSNDQIKMFDCESKCPAENN